MTSVETYWFDDNQQIIIVEFGEVWDWESFYITADKSYQMIDTVSHNVVQILDLRNFKTMPEKVFLHGRKALSNKPHPQIKAIVMVDLNYYLTAVYNAFERMLPQHFVQKWNMVFVNTMEEAIDVAKERLNET